MSLDPRGVAERLARLRALYEPEPVETAALRLEAERPRAELPFALAVEARLAELRALCDLAAYLHRDP